jgi:hypothetical protein
MPDDIELKSGKVRGIEFAGWLSGFVIFTFIVPILIIMILPSDKIPAAIGTLFSVPVIEYLAISVGIGLGINPVLSFLLTVLPCIGFAMLVTGLLGFLVDSSGRATKFLERVQKRLDKYPRLKKYGVASNFVFIMILGMYLSPGISIIMGWSRVRSMAFMFGGICVITLLIGLGTLGIIELFFV